MNPLSLYKHSLALLTDFYEITMAYAYFKSGNHVKEAVFHHFFRKKPFGGEFAIISGLEALIDFIENFKFSTSDLNYLSNIKGENQRNYFDDDFLNFLYKFKFNLDIDAMPEGTCAFPFEPIVRVKGPIIDCQILETALLNLLNFSSLISTKAARLRIAATSDLLVEFGLRRAQGIDGGITASRASYIGGVDATSNVLAGKMFSIPVKGTHAHSWVMSFENEMQSFKEWIEVFEDNTILLVDTYETIEGVKNAINIGIQLRKKGKKLGGIRLDSGDLLSLSKEARQMLDEHAFYDTKIFATNELDEIKIESLKKGGCKVNAWGVGTHLVTGHPKGALDGVYKLSAIKESLNCNWIFKAKISQNEEKVSTPGILDVRRIKEAGLFVKDVIYSNPLAYEASKNSEGLLVKIYKEGRLVYKKPSLEEIRKKVKEELAALPSDVKLLENPKKYSVFWDEEILKIRKGLGLNG